MKIFKVHIENFKSIRNSDLYLKNINILLEKMKKMRISRKHNLYDHLMVNREYLI